METSKQCTLGRACMVHSFDPRISKRLIGRAFSIIVDENFTEDEQRYFWSVSRGER